MLRLRTLGSFSLLDASGSNTAVPPHRLALLALLAAAGERGITRDKVLAYLWPEATPPKARASLEQMLHMLRSSLDYPSALRGNPLRLSEDFASSDVSDFRAALEAEDLEAAVRLYGGPFLDGFYLSGVPEFEEWLERERSLLADQFVGALERIASEATAQGKHALAVQHLRALGAVTPHSGRTVLRLMQALVAHGDRHGALEAAERYSVRVREQLGAEPELDVTRLVEALRQQTFVEISRSQPVVLPAVPLPATDFARPPNALVEPVEIVASSRRTTWRSMLTVVRWAVIPTVMLALVAASYLFWRQRALREAPASTRFVVFPFDAHGGPEFAYLGEAAMDLLSEAIHGAGDLRRVDPRSVMRRLQSGDGTVVDPRKAQQLAIGFGAGRFVLGTVTQTGPGMRFSASLYNSSLGGDPIATSTRDGSQENLAGIVEGVAQDLLAGESLGSGARLEDIRGVHSANFKALRAYLQAEVMLRRGWYDSAGAKLVSAVREDSTFGLAWYRLAYAQSWGAEGDRSESFEHAMRYRGSLSYRDRTLIEARNADNEGDAATAERLTTDLVGRFPDDAEAWHLLGIVRAAYRWQRGIPHWVAREPLRRALALDPDYPETVSHAVSSGFAAALYSHVDSLMPRYPKGGGAAPVRIGINAALAFAIRGAAAQDSVFSELASQPDRVAFNVGTMISATDSLPAAARVWRQVATNPDRGEFVRATAQMHLALNEVARGRRQAAETEFALAGQYRSGLRLLTHVQVAVNPFFQYPEAQLVALRDSVRRWRAAQAGSADERLMGVLWMPNELHHWTFDYLTGLLAARLGDVPAAEHHAAVLEAALEPRDSIGLRRDFALEIRALGALQAGRHGDALALLERATMRVSRTSNDLNSFNTRPLGRFLRAESLFQLGRFEEALGWYDAFGTKLWGTEYVYRAPLQLRMGEIYERLRQPERAIAHYKRFIAAWRDADAEYQPLVRDVLSRLTRLQRRA